MKKQRVMSGVLLLVGAMLIPAYVAQADIVGQNNVGTIGDMNLFGNIHDGSMSGSTASLTLGIITGLDFFVPSATSSDDSSIPQKSVIKTRITAYTSTPDQTDDTPFTTASGADVHDGIIASNFLPFGTRIIIPSLFGGKVFTVEDRMNPRYRHSIDIWMSNNSHALRFGVQYAEIQIVGSAKQDMEQFALSL